MCLCKHIHTIGVSLNKSFNATNNCLRREEIQANLTKVKTFADLFVNSDTEERTYLKFT